MTEAELLVCEVGGGKWPGLWERLVVDADGAARYEVRSAPRLLGPGRAVGRFAAPPDRARAAALRAALERLPGAVPESFPPGAAVVTLSRDGRPVARWTPADAPPLVDELRAAAEAATAHPAQALTMTLAPDGPALGLTAAGAEPVTLAPGDPQARLDLRFADGSRRVLSPEETRVALGGRTTPLRVAPGRPALLPLTLPADEVRAPVGAVLVARADLGAGDGPVSLATEGAR